MRPVTLPPIIGPGPRNPRPTEKKQQYQNNQDGALAFKALRRHFYYTPPCFPAAFFRWCGDDYAAADLIFSS